MRVIPNKFPALAGEGAALRREQVRQQFLPSTCSSLTSACPAASTDASSLSGPGSDGRGLKVLYTSGYAGTRSSMRAGSMYAAITTPAVAGVPYFARETRTATASSR